MGAPDAMTPVFELGTTDDAEAFTARLRVLADALVASVSSTWEVEAS